MCGVYMMEYLIGVTSLVLVSSSKPNYMLYSLCKIVK